MKRFFLISFLVLFLVGGCSGNLAGNEITEENSEAVLMEDGTQVIEILAKGGFSPRKITATAGIPTLLKVETRGTYDCSASLVIPQMKYQKLLEATGVEEIQLSAEEAQGSFTGLCGMGMYSFEVIFE